MKQCESKLECEENFCKDTSFISRNKYLFWLFKRNWKNNVFKRKIGTCGLTWKQSIKKLLNVSEVSFSNNSLVKNQ